MVNALANPRSRSLAPMVLPGERGSLPEQFADALQLRVDAGDLSPATRQTYLNGLSRFIAWLESNSLSSVGPEDIRQWRADMLKRKATPGSVNVWLSGVRTFYQWATSESLLGVNPTAGIKGAKRNGINRRHKRSMLTDEQARALLALELPARERALVALMLYTGARGIELQRADVSDIRTVDGHLCLMVQGKGHASDELEPLVLVNPAVIAALEAWLTERGSNPGPLFTSRSNRNAGERVSMVWVRTTVKAALRAIGVNSPDVSTHSLRHTAITRVAKRGGPRAAQVFARHASLDTTMIYMHELDRLANPPERFVNYDGGDEAEGE